MSLDLLAVGGAFALGVLLTGVGRLQLVCATLFFSMFVLPWTLYGATVVDRYRVGIAGAEPQIATYTVAVVLVLAMAYLLRGPRPNMGQVAPFLVFVVVWATLVWPHTSEVRAGVVHLGMACLAWGVGTYVAKLMLVEPRGPEILLGWLLVIMLLQAAVCFAQFQGIAIFSADGAVIIEDASLEGREGGTLGHPGTVGKAVFLMLVLALPWIGSERGKVRSRALGIVLVSLVPLGLSGGRANAIACMAAVVLVVLLDPGTRRWGNRVKASIAIAGGVSATWGLWVDRFATGEKGQFRARFFDTAVDFLRDAPPLAGTGANTYVTAVGPTDPMAAIGWLVHNVYLLAAVELGILGAALFFLPVVSSLVRGWRARKRLGPEGGYGRGLLAAAPGMLLITWTGWGMMAAMVVPWMLVTGFATAVASRRDAPSDSPGQTEQVGRAATRAGAARVSSKR